MQIVIDIDDKVYEMVMNTGSFGNHRFNTSNAIRKGTPLPKGHGDLVDYEELKNNAREHGAYTEATLSHIKPKTIIEADKAESEVEE